MVKIPVATTIPLSPLDGEEFYAVIIPEEKSGRKTNAMWLFRKGCGMAICNTSRRADNDDPAMTVDGIRALDASGKFDEGKEELLELK